MASKIFYTDQPTNNQGSVKAVGLDGTAPSTVITYPVTSNLRGIAWHRALGRIFVLDNGAKVIQSLFPNGLSQMDVVPVDLVRLGSDLEVDDTTNKIFWSETNVASADEGLIRSANPDGTGVTTVVSAGSGSESPYFFWLDRPGGFIYWGVAESLVSQNSPTTYRRSSFAGVTDPTFAITTDTRSRDIAVDPTTSIAYWGDRQRGTIFRRSLDGTTNETVISGMNAPHGLAIDVQARKVYWADTGQRGSGGGASSRRVARCNFDGAELEILTSTDGFNEPWDLALDLSCPTYADWRARFFSTTSDLREPIDDADADGSENLLEYAFDSNPRDGAVPVGPKPLPNGISYPRRRVSPLAYRVEVSTDFVTWRYNGDSTGQMWTSESSVTPVDVEMDSVVIEPAVALSGAQRIFYRVRISMNEPLAAAFSTNPKRTKPMRLMKTRMRRR